jgi:c-di-GMP-binding flagellar brake protein YcgR
MADNQIFMNEISDRHTQEQYLDEVCSRQCRIEISTDEGKFISDLEGTFWRSEGKIYVKAAPSSIALKVGTKYKATILGNNLILGILTSIKEINDKIIKLNYPEKVFKINRREAFRFKIPGAYQIPVTLVTTNNKKFDGVLFDISVEGVGVWINTDSLPVGTKFSQVYFKLETKEIYAIGEIKVVFPLELNKKKGFKVGIKLDKFSQGGQGSIVSYMNRHLSQYAKKNA